MKSCWTKEVPDLLTCVPSTTGEDTETQDRRPCREALAVGLELRRYGGRDTGLGPKRHVGALFSHRALVAVGSGAKRQNNARRRGDCPVRQADPPCVSSVGLGALETGGPSGLD